MIQRSYELYSDLCGLERLTLETAMRTAVDASPEFCTALGTFRGAVVAERNRLADVVEAEVRSKLLGRG